MHNSLHVVCVRPNNMWTVIAMVPTNVIIHEIISLHLCFVVSFKLCCNMH